jgi:glutamyl-tRNA reductase
MYSLQLYGIDHTRAPLPEREPLTFGPEEQQELLPLLLNQPGKGLKEALLLSTCNRTEFYFVRESGAGDDPLSPLGRFRPAAQLLRQEGRRYSRQGYDAIAHLFAVASSLRSQLPGDTQIASQVAQAAAVARRAGTCGPYLDRATTWALRTAKRVRRETALSAGSAGLGPAVLRMVRRHSVAVHQPRPVSILLLGAGKVADEVLRHLARSSGPSSAADFGQTTVRIHGIWSRDRNRAARLAARIGCSTVDGNLLTSMQSADVVVGACRGRVPQLNDGRLIESLGGRVTPLVFVDLGVPRNLDPKWAAADGLISVSLDEIQSQMRDRLALQKSAIEAAERIVHESAKTCGQWWTNFRLHGLRGELFAAVESVLETWHSREPGPVRAIRPRIHRLLTQTFRTVNLEYENRLYYR